MLLQLEVWTLKLTPCCTWETGALLKAESKMLAATAEVNNPQSLMMHKSGLELWRLLKYNFGRASAINVMGILASISNMQTAKNMQDVMSTTQHHRATTSRRLQTSCSTQGLSVYPGGFKKADSVKVLLDSIVKELKTSANINFEKDSQSEIRDVVTTIVHNHMNAATPMDVDTHIMSIEQENSH